MVSEAGKQLTAPAQPHNLKTHICHIPDNSSNRNNRNCNHKQTTTTL